MLEGEKEAEEERKEVDNGSSVYHLVNIFLHYAEK